MNATPIGFLITSLSLVNFAHVTQYLLNEHALSPPILHGNTSSSPGPIIINDLHIYAPKGHVALSKDANGMLVTYGSNPALDNTANLLYKYLTQGPRFLKALASEEGWATVGFDFNTNKILVATDAFATKPVFLASRVEDNCPMTRTTTTTTTPSGCGPSGFAISSHHSALERLGFTVIREVNMATVMVLENPTLNDRFSLDLSSFAPRSHPSPPPLLKAQKAVRALPTAEPTAALDVDFQLAIKKSVGMVLRRPQKKPLSPSPRLFLVRQGGINCLKEHDLLISSLEKLPINFDVYHIDPNAETIHKIKYLGGQQQAPPTRTPQALPLLEAKAINLLEPSLSQAVGAPLLLAFATICQDAHANGVPVYLSGTNAFHTDDLTTSTAILRMEEYTTQAYGIVSLWPLLSWDVIQTFRSLHVNTKRAVHDATCSALQPSARATISQIHKTAASEVELTGDHSSTRTKSPLSSGPQGGEDGDAFDLLAYTSPAVEAQAKGDTEGAMAYLQHLLITPSANQGIPRPLQANLSAELGILYQIQGHVPEAIQWYRKAVEIDPSLHSAYVLMARLGLGPESPIAKCSSQMKEQVIKGLRSAIDELGHHLYPFREVSLYNLGAALYYSQGKDSEAEQVYRDIIKLPPDGSISKKYELQSTGRVDESVVVITVASSLTPELANLVASAEAAGVDVRVLGQGVTYTGHEVKLQLYWDFVASNATDDDQLIVAVDAYDVILTPAIARIPGIYRSFNRPVIFAAERACWPDAGVSLLYEATGRGGHELPYLNSGSFIGRRQDLFRMLQEVTGYEARFASDQRLFTRFYLEHPEIVELDHLSKMFYMLHYTVSPLLFDGSGRAQVAGLDGEPAVLHANAGDGKAFYGRMVSAWQQAHKTNSSAMASNLPYFRGVSHFGRGETVLALTCLLSHLANHTNYLPEVTYNVAYTLQALQEHDLARLYYLRSLHIGESEEVRLRSASSLVMLERLEGTLEVAHQLIREALALDASNRTLLALNRAMSEVMQQDDQGSSGSDKTTNSTTSGPQDSWLRDAYLPTQDGGVDVNNVLGDHRLGTALARLLDGKDKLSQAFQHSPYYAVGQVLCHPPPATKAGQCHDDDGDDGDHQPPTTAAGGGFFPYERVLRLFYYMDNSETKPFCDEFLKGLHSFPQKGVTEDGGGIGRSSKDKWSTTTTVISALRTIMNR